jgi:prevent-host-death family protein
MDQKPINIAEAKSHLSDLVSRAEAGEEIVIARSGKPVAKLVPIKKERRKPGFAKGRGWPDLGPEDFAPMTGEELAWANGEFNDDNFAFSPAKLAAYRKRNKRSK